MADGVFDLSSRAGDLALQHRYPRLEFGDGQRIEVLTHEGVESVVGTGKGIFRLHRADNVDPGGAPVNNARDLGYVRRA